MKTFFRTIKKNDLRYGRFALIYICAAIITSVCNVLVTKLTGDISQAAIDFDVNVIVSFLLTMAGITGVQVIAAALAAVLSGRFSGKIGYRLRENFAKHFTFIPFAGLEKKNSGELLSLYANDLPNAENFMTSGTFKLIMDIIYVVVVFIYMATINPVLTLIYFIMFPFMIMLQAAIAGPIQKKSIASSTEKARFNAVVNDSLQNTSTIIAYSLEDVMEKRYLACYDKYYDAMMSYIRSLISLVMTGIVATLLPILFIYMAAGFNVVNNKMSMGEFVAFTAIASVAANWLAMLSQRLGNIQVAAAGAVRLGKNTEDVPEDIGTGIKDIGDNDIAVRLSNVSFSYTEDTNILSRVSFDIKKGEKVAIVGSSGSGKSTVLKLLLALYDTYDGDIYVFGKNIRDISRGTLRANLAYVPQDSFMFPDTIGENIKCGRQSIDGKPITDARLAKACDNAGILDFIEGLPDGFDTMLSEAAENISGGQRQRLAIARAYLADAPIVLFDEATSALDAITEADVLKAFYALAEGRTAVMVAHRIKAITACDAIIVMDKGKISAIGKHDDLLKKNKIYAMLYENQSKEERENEETEGEKLNG